jgi:hypothetical protein
MRIPQLFCLAALFILAATGWAARRDPLTTPEVDQLREAAQVPEERLKLYVKFVRARMTMIEHLRSDPRLALEDRPTQVHNLLEDIDELVQEMDDNIDDYLSRNADLRKPLKEVIAADSEFQLKLRELQQATGEEAEKERHEYRFALENALSSVNTSLDNARRELQEQEEKFKAEKNEKKKK